MAGGTYPLDSDGAAARMSIAATRWQVVRRHAEDGEWLAPVEPLKRGRRTHPDLQAFIEGLALSKPRRSIAAIARKAQPKAAQQGWPMVSYTTVRSIVGSLDPGMVMLAHHGPVAYRDHFEL